jgi:hypothetical protein
MKIESVSPERFSDVVVEDHAVHRFYRSIGYSTDDVVVFSRRLDEPA